MRPFEYWQSGAGLAHITPPSSPNPEGAAFGPLMTELFFGQDMVEFGCGTGRLAPLFSKRRYRGVDICEAAIVAAQATKPGYRFEMIDGISPIEGGFGLLAHTVMLHVPDEDLIPTIRRFAQRHVVVSEIPGKQWRRDGNPPVFNRGIMDYEEAFRLCGYKLSRVMFVPYPHYENTDLAVMQFHKEKEGKASVAD